MKHANNQSITAAKMLEIIMDKMSSLDEYTTAVTTRAKHLVVLIYVLFCIAQMPPCSPDHRYYQHLASQWEAISDEAGVDFTPIDQTFPEEITVMIINHWESLHDYVRTWRALTDLMRIYPDAISDSPKLRHYITKFISGSPDMEHFLDVLLKTSPSM